MTDVTFWKRHQRQLLVLGVSLACLIFLVTRANNSSARDLIGPGLVKVIVTSNPWDLDSPWQKAGTKSVSGTGVIIDGQRILTNAHVVENEVNIQVKRSGTTKTYTAKVAYVAHECDLALLTVSDSEFFKGVDPLPFGDVPQIRDQVEVHGFPVGGETASVTAGIVSRIEIGTYAHSGRDLLLIQVDAAMNPGNSGGPVTSGRAIVGIATQSLNDAENVGYIIPVPVIKHFLTDIKDEKLDGFPALGLTLEELESDAHRRSLGMTKSETGTLVTEIDYGASAWGSVETGDVLLSIDGRPIANDKSIALPAVGRVNLAYLVQTKQVGEKVDLLVLHAGERKHQQAVLKANEDLVPGFQYDTPPTYMVFAGLVFQPLDLSFLGLFKDAPGVLERYAWNANLVTPERSQIILINKVLADEVNQGYQDWNCEIVWTVNGIVPRDMAHLASIIDEAKGPYLQITTEDNWVMALDLDEARSVTPTILAKYGIHDDRSESLRLAKTTQAVAGNVD
jgi:S1-C subfamily serine protease